MEPQLSTTPTPTGPERVLLESAPPALAADPTTSMARGALMLSQRLMLSMVITVTPDTTEPPPPSLPGAPRDWARGALTPSQDTSTEPTLTPSPQCPTPPTAMDLQDTPLVRVTPGLPPPSSP